MRTVPVLPLLVWRQQIVGLKRSEPHGRRAMPENALPGKYGVYQNEVAADIAACVAEMGCQPILFVGSGLSKRYFGGPSWDELLTYLAKSCPLIDKDYAYYKQALGSPLATGKLFAEKYQEWAWSSGRNSFPTTLFDQSISAGAYIKHFIAEHLVVHPVSGMRLLWVWSVTRGAGPGWEVAMTLRVRALSEEEAHRLARMTRSQKLGAGLVRRARIIQHAVDGLSAPEIAARMGLCGATVRFWLKRFNERGLGGLEEDVRSGRPPTYTAEERSAVIAAALSRPADLDLPFASWTLDRLVAYLGEKGIGMKRSRVSEVLLAEGLKWRQEETWFGARVDPEFERKRGRSSASTPPRPRAA